MKTKERPLVDTRVFDLAETWMEDYAIRADTADAASDSHQDAIWDLASEIQHAIESWLNDEIERARLVEIATKQ